VSLDPLPLQFLRPLWLLGLGALPLLLWWWWRRERRADPWRAHVDPHLLRALQEQPTGVRRASRLLPAAVAGLLAVLAMAGPSWRSVEQPLQPGQEPLVVALDLSSATLAGDLPPSRLLQARAKLGELLRRRAGGQVGLVAFADDAYTVAPLTFDVANVALFLDALAPDVMPVDGSRPDRAIARAVELMDRAGFDRGDVLVLTDGADAAALAAATRAAAAGYRVSVLGLGRAEGAAYRKADGSVARAGLDRGALRDLAAAGNGRYSDWTPGVEDLREVAVLVADGAQGTDVRGGARVPQDGGYWLLPPLMLLAALAFRRNGALAVVLLCALLPWQPAQAQSGGWWQRDDQAEHARSADAASAYRAGRYEEAARGWRTVPGADAAYNRGNALARAGRYGDAIAAYDQALRLRPGMADALANRQAVQAALQRQPPSPGSDQASPAREREGGDGAAQSGDGAAGASSNPAGGVPESSVPPPTAGSSPPEDASSAPAPADDARQREADAAQRGRMQRAIDAPRTDDGTEPDAAPAPDETDAQRERRQANDAWLRRVPDDPGGLLRAKFQLEHERRQQSGGEPRR
jgi:Ca-activated chloride channel homolog